MLTNMNSFSLFITTDTNNGGERIPQVSGNPVFVTKGSID